MSTETKFEDHGTLAKPGPVGRIARLALGIACFYFLYVLFMHGNRLVGIELPRRLGWWFGMAMGFYVFPYVVNIGFTRSWGRRPQWIILILALAAAVLSFAQYGSFWGPPLGWLMRVWLFYVYAHLGVSLFLSAIIATPGCEMRAIPHLWTLLTGRATKEHYCPGFFDKIDKWEASRKSRRLEKELS